MKRQAIKTQAEKHLANLGVSRGQFVWQPMTAELMVIVGDGFRKVQLKSGISQRDFMFEMGRITGWIEATAPEQIVPPKKLSTATTNHANGSMPNAATPAPAG